MSTRERIIAWQRASHYGIGLGGGYKFLVFVSGMIIPGQGNPSWRQPSRRRIDGYFGARS